MKHTKTSLETRAEDNEHNRQQPKIYAKNSMDRFDDHLCALLLSYKLSVKNRFRLEKVSKQFQRTVFGSVVDITLKDRFIDKLITGDTIDAQVLGKITTKCPNIQTIDCRGMRKHVKHIPELL
ncbi:unnamed protein product [Medioppia subpectinata]|uniref:Uncharacterized protein n=1 Tax=Medioppia subpectinata TaxID=1979941 RepID=A0A7R9KPW9_9ACAR|nr:unnamed protein product [Medioppia subpectinata]CAG2106348.1 unnamed protein product [Medioppia subpectinata]